MRFKNIKPAILALALLSAMESAACISEAPRHNNYLFSVFNRALIGDRFTDASDKYWQQYLGASDSGANACYRYRAEEIMELATKRKDSETVAYCTLLNDYLGLPGFDGWSYPTKEDLAKRGATLRHLLQASTAYKGTRYASQYALLRMRSLFGLKRYGEAAAWWETTGQKLPQSVYRDMMLNIYAGCLWRTGKKNKAVEIYAAQEDYRSLKYCVRGYRNLAGIKKVYAGNPNSATLNYLVQDFVNNVQETQDVYLRGNGLFLEFGRITLDDLDDKAKDDYIKEVDARKITEAEAGSFIAFARTVVASGKTKVPSLWQAAIGCLEHQTRRYKEAEADLRKAMAMAGTARMKDNARAIYAANSIFAKPQRGDYDSWMAGELRWLDEKSAEDRGSSTLYATDHYRDVKERMVYNGLIPSLQASGNTFAALAMMSMMEETDNAGQTPLTHTPYYSGIYFEYLDKMPADSLALYAQRLTQYAASQNAASPLEDYACQRAYRNADFYNDLIGTKLLAQGRFAEAIPYLEKVGIEFLNTQNIKPYAYYRDYSVERWMRKQKIGDEEYWNMLQGQDGPSLKENKKLLYCHDMLRLQQELLPMRQCEARMAKAYELATLWYQGSFEGDCWWLKRYGVSMAEDREQETTLDFVAKAQELLGESAQSSSFRLREKSLYALASIRNNDPWFKQGWDETTDTYYDLYGGVLCPMPQSGQYKAMKALAALYRDNTPEASTYVSKCDVLARFVKIARQVLD